MVRMWRPCIGGLKRIYSLSIWTWQRKTLKGHLKLTLTIGELPLEIDPENWGAIFCLWGCHSLAGNWPNLELPFISPNRDVKLEYKILKDKVREYNKKEAQFYSNIFAKMNKLEQTNSTVNRQNPNLFKSVVMVTLCLLLTVFLVYGVWYGNADGSKAGSNANDHR